MNALAKLKTVARIALRPEARADARFEWARRLRGAPELPAGPIRRVLVICHGNVCRSPFGQVALARRLPSLEVRSAGLDVGEPGAADATATAVASERGVSLAEHRSQAASDALIEWADLVLGMQGRHAAELVRRWPAAATRVRLLGHFLGEPPYDIADPWGRSPEVFAATFDRMGAAIDALVKRLEESGA